MTHVELHVFEPNIQQCIRLYVRELIRSRNQYSKVCLCVDDAEQASIWRTTLGEYHALEIFEYSSAVPNIPFQGEILVSLSSHVTPMFSSFKQTIDIVVDTESAREDGRTRYRFYRDRGYPLRHIKIQAKEVTQ